MTEVLVLVVLGAVGLLALAGVEHLVADSLVGIRLVVILAVGITLLDDAMPSPVIAGFTVTPADTLFGLIAVAAVLRLLRARRLGTGHYALVALATLVVLSLVRGIAMFGLPAAINESRTFLYFVFGCLYFSLADPTPVLRRAAGRWWLYAATGLIGVVLLRWAVLVGGLPTSGIFGRVEEAGGIRVIDNPAALQIAWVLFMLVPLQMTGRLTLRWHRWLGGLSVVTLLLLNHRTIWIALLAGVVVVAVREPRIGRRVAGGLAVMAVAASFAITGLQNVEDSPLPQDPLSTETLLWRYEGWVGLIYDGALKPVDVLVGRPLGSGYSREVFGYTVDVTPHNWYLQVYLRTGLFGLAAFVLAGASALRTLWHRPDDDPEWLFSNLALVVGLIMQGVYFLTWSPSLAHGLPIGLVIALATDPRRGQGQPGVPINRPRPGLVETSLPVVRGSTS